MKDPGPSWRTIAVSLMLGAFCGCRPQVSVRPILSEGAVIRQQGMGALQEELARKVTAGTAKAMSQPGLVGALGGAHVRLLTTGTHEILLPLPQLADSQVPVCYYIRGTPADAVIEYHLRKREDCNHVIISRRLEMHRIVEYFDEDAWHPFDPSSLQTDVPLKPWQNIIMAKTTVADEELAMQPRMGSMPGCPYAQEAEMMSTGVNLAGQDFFWTIAKPVADFEAGEEAIALAADAWNRYLETGTLSPGQVKAASAENAAEFLEFLRAE